MAKESNLKPFTSNQDREQAKINGRKGGKARQAQVRRRKALKEQMELLLTLPLTDERAKKQFESMGIDAAEP